MDFLPTDLKFTIFTKLSSKSILICKCVCKQWYDFLSHPNFTRTYARDSPLSSLLLLRPRLDANWSSLLEFDADGGLIWTHLIPQIPNFHQIPNFRPVPNFHQLRRISESVITVIGSCNGLLFFRQSGWIRNCNRVVGKVYCCNPLFGGCLEIAEEESQELPGGADLLWRVRYTIGHVSSTDNFKLLRITSKVGSNNEEDRQSDILTVGIDRTWRRVDDGSMHWYFDGLYNYKVRKVSINGAYHWIEQQKWLCSFDFGEEKIGPKLMLPEVLQQRLVMDLVELNNHLSAVVIKIAYNLVHIWTMKEYGVADSWCLTKTIILDRAFLNLSFPIITFANGDILYSDCRGQPIVYVTNNGGIKVHDFTITTGILYAAEFTPRFYPLDQSWDLRNTPSEKVRSDIFRFFRTLLIDPSMKDECCYLD